MEEEKANHFYDRARCCLVLAYAPASFIRVAEDIIIGDSALNGYLTNSAAGGGGVAGRDGQHAYLYLLLSEWDGVCHCEKCSAWQRRLLRADNGNDDGYRGYEPRIYKLGHQITYPRDEWDRLLIAHARWVKRGCVPDPSLQRESKFRKRADQSRNEGEQLDQ